MKITKNPNWSAEQHAAFSKRLADNGGYCPCRIQHTPENRCLCVEFQKQMESPAFFGTCHCGRYVKEKS